MGAGILERESPRDVFGCAAGDAEWRVVEPALVIGFKFVFVLGAIGAGIKFLGWHPNGVALGIATIFTGVAFAMIHGIISPPSPPTAPPIDPQQQNGGPSTDTPQS